MRVIRPEHDLETHKKIVLVYLICLAGGKGRKSEEVASKSPLIFSIHVYVANL